MKKPAALYQEGLTTGFLPLEMLLALTAASILGIVPSTACLWEKARHNPHNLGLSPFKSQLYLGIMEILGPGGSGDYTNWARYH